MDIYAHSNWVEMGFPLSPDNPSTASVDVGRSDLLDLSGAQRALPQSWAVDTVVRGDIRLANDDFGIPSGWSIDPDGGGTHVPTLIDRQGLTVGRLLITGKGTADTEDVGPPKRYPEPTLPPQASSPSSPRTSSAVTSSRG